MKNDGYPIGMSLLEAAPVALPRTYERPSTVTVCRSKRYHQFVCT